MTPGRDSLFFCNNRGKQGEKVCETGSRRTAPSGVSWNLAEAKSRFDFREVESCSDWAGEAKMGAQKLLGTGSAICSQGHPKSFRCSAQFGGSRGVRRINCWAEINFLQNGAARNRRMASGTFTTPQRPQDHYLARNNINRQIERVAALSTNLAGLPSKTFSRNQDP